MLPIRGQQVDVLWCIHTHVTLGWDGMDCAGNSVCECRFIEIH